MSVESREHRHGDAPGGSASSVERREDHVRGAQTTIAIAGPLSLFHGTSVYGRALGELVPLLAELSQWSLELRVELPSMSYVAHVTSPALLPAPPPRLVALPYPTARLVRTLRRLEPRLEVVPSPSGLRAGTTLLWPDLAIDVDGMRRCYVELVGFWTRDYLARKIAAYRDLGDQVVLCVDTKRAAGEGVAPSGVLTYAKTLPADALLAAVRARAPAHDHALPLAPLHVLDPL
jgi:predicted nuclease of restriction endonuclease-like RecB superfamily